MNTTKVNNQIGPKANSLTIGFTKLNYTDH